MSRQAKESEWKEAGGAREVVVGDEVDAVFLQEGLVDAPRGIAHLGSAWGGQEGGR